MLMHATHSILFLGGFHKYVCTVVIWLNSAPTRYPLPAMTQLIIVAPPISFIDGKFLTRLSACCTKHWRLTGVYSMTHVITFVSNTGVRYDFVADEFADRIFNADYQVSNDIRIITSLIDQVSAVATFRRDSRKFARFDDSSEAESHDDIAEASIVTPGMPIVPHTLDDPEGGFFNPEPMPLTSSTILPPLDWWGLDEEMSSSGSD